MRKFFSNKHLGHWIRIGAEYIAVILLIFHLLPEKFVSEWKTNGMAVVILLGITLILSLVFRYKGEEHLRNEIGLIQNDLTTQIEKIKSLHRLTCYSNVFPILNEAFSKLHDTMRGEHLEQEYRDAFKDFCTKLAHVFRNVTGVDCSVCIKIPIKTRNNNRKITNLKAKTLVRDALSIKRDSIDSIRVDHFFQQNTDFEYIFNHINSDKGRYFLNNNLPSIPNYKNTSFLAKGDSITYFHEGASIEEKEKDWPLPYKASIATPICPGISNQRSLGTLFGFLCVDSVQANVFNEKIDPELVCGCADGLYNPLKTYIEKFLIKK